MILTNIISHDTVALTSNLAECLFILISNQGEIISQDYFINEVWGRKKMFVSENTLVQNISKLRNQMNSVGLRRDYIVTKKNEGYYFSLEVDVIMVDKNNESINNCDDISKHQNSKEREGQYYSKNVKKSIFLLGMTLTMLIISFILYKDYIINSTPSIVYTYTTTIDKCKIFFNNKLDYEKNSLLDIILKQNNISCKIKSYIYVTSYPLSAHYSYIKCNESIENKSENKTCISVVRHNYVKDI